MRKMFYLEEIASAVGGEVVNSTGVANNQIFVSGVSKDTRTINEGDLYVAIVGENFDGHKFCDIALEKGASVLLVSDVKQIPDGSAAVVCEDTVKALGLLAKHYRFKLNAKVICVTGSVGKTTTREMIASAIKASKKVCATKANLNNEIGLPMTILEAPEDTEVLVLEMGMRLRGEISYLTNIACPDIAVITNAGYCHIERLGSREEIRLAKTEIIEGLTDGGILLISSDDPFLFDYVRNILPVGKGLAAVSANGSLEQNIPNCPVILNARNINLDNGIEFDIEGAMPGFYREYKGVKLNLNGAHYITTAMFAFACANFVGADEEKAVKALSEYKEMKGRGQVTKCEDYIIINDAYNAGPESMMASYFNLSVFGGANSKVQKIAVLGGMLELGDYAPMLHEMIGKDCGKYHFDHILVTGDNSQDFVKGLLDSDANANYKVCANNDEIKAELKSIVNKGDIILFKASNAFGFEKMALEMVQESTVIDE